MTNARTVRKIVTVSLASAAAWAFVLACTTVVETNYGDPTALRSDNLPGEGGLVITSACEAGLPADIVQKNREAGAAEAGAVACNVQFARDLYPRIMPDGGWRCAASACHGGANGPAPKIDTTTPESVLTALRGSDPIGGIPYLPAGNRDPAKASMYCNLARSCDQVPAMPPSPPLVPSEVCALETWIKCGAPQN
ncbi:MAG: hypothetical protein U0169_03555 [Polyangiaceae bacterium]